MPSLHDSLTSSASLSVDNDGFEIVSVMSDNDLHQTTELLYNSHPNFLNGGPHGGGGYLGRQHSHTSELQLPQLPPEPVPAPGALERFDTACLSPEDVQSFVRRYVDGEDSENEEEEMKEPQAQPALDESLAIGTQQDALKGYKINKPPTMRPVRVYIAALYDVLHPGHVLNLRQAKYSFPSVHLLVGVYEHAPSHAPAIFSHLERLETVRHIRYIDELIPSAPTMLTESFIREWNLDYIAYEEDTPWADPGYQLARRLGKFLPLRGTGAISTGEVLQRLRGEGESRSTSALGYHSKDPTLTTGSKGLAPSGHSYPEFTPLTPASYHGDAGEQDSPPPPNPIELLDPFTN